MRISRPLSSVLAALALVVTLVPSAPTAGAKRVVKPPVPTTTTWTGKGTDVVDATRVLDEEQCDADQTPYLQWVLAATRATSARISIGTSIDVPMTRTGGRVGAGNFKYRWMPDDAIDLDELLASGVTATTTGARHRGVLTISSGCLGVDGGDERPPGPFVGWGYNGFGQLGNGQSSNVNTPVAVDVSGVLAGVRITDVAVGTHHTCAVGGGAVYCWGINSEGAVGDGTLVGRDRPVAVVGFPANTTIVGVTAGAYHTCALDSTGGVHCWGRNVEGQLAETPSPYRATPVKVTALAGVTVTAVEAGGWHTCALTSTGSVLCWGSNLEGQLGIGTNVSTATPTSVDTTGTPMAGRTIASISLGIVHSCALDTAGLAYCWGYDGEGQLGNGTTGLFPRPQAVVTAGTPLEGRSIRVLAAAGYHTCAIDQSGAVSCWGRNADGQVGDGTTVAKSVPTAVVSQGSPLLATGITGGQFFTCSVNGAGAVTCWGDNQYGQLGNGTNVDSSVPVAVATTGSALTAPVDHVTTGTFSHHALAW